MTSSALRQKEETMYDLKDLSLTDLFKVRDAVRLLASYGIEIPELTDSVDTELLTREG